MSKVLVNESSLTGIANAIRGKNGETTTYKPSEMAAAITAISGGGEPDIPESAFVISGDCSYRFANGGWDWFIEQYGDMITTENISSAASMFYKTTLKSIPFSLNFKNDSYYDYANMFYSANSLTSIGNIINAYFGNINDMFSSCYRLRYLPQFENCNFSRIQTYKYTTCANMFKDCYSLRSISEDFIKQISQPLCTSSFFSFLSRCCFSCYSLDEIKGLNPQTGIITSNIFGSSIYDSSFGFCSRIKNLTFTLQDDGTPYTVSWKDQTIDLSNYNGWAKNKYNILNYNSGITADKEVTDDVTYQALKNDPDWFTTNVAYSRYNHDSAVATINSLPDTSAYLASASGTNTVKLKGAAGSATDGGAINTLTEEEIAVATAKGWTVTLV